jgi:CRP/FNR family transcriptional regulator, cyclic AMP receptor protein
MVILTLEFLVIEASKFKNYSLFGGLLPEEIEAIRPLMSGASYASGELIMREGEPNDRIHFILDGEVEILKGGVQLARLGEGDTFGEMEFLDVMPAAATVRALSPATVAAISNHALHELSKASMRAFAMLVMNLARDLSRRLRRMDDIVARATERGSSPEVARKGE